MLWHFCLPTHLSSLLSFRPPFFPSFLFTSYLLSLNPSFLPLPALNSLIILFYFLLLFFSLSSWFSLPFCPFIFTYLLNSSRIPNTQALGLWEAHSPLSGEERGSQRAIMQGGGTSERGKTKGWGRLEAGGWRLEAGSWRLEAVVWQASYIRWNCLAIFFGFPMSIHKLSQEEKSCLIRYTLGQIYELNEQKV